MTIDIVAQYIGYAVMIAGGVFGASLCVIGAALLSNKAQHAAVDSCGGWKVFCEFREWIYSNRSDDKADRVA